MEKRVALSSGGQVGGTDNTDPDPRDMSGGTVVSSPRHVARSALGSVENPTGQAGGSSESSVPASTSGTRGGPRMTLLGLRILLT